MTDRLYYAESALGEFTATVLSCEEREGSFELLLDRTAFFPGGGGQPADRGRLGGRTVLELLERDDAVVHVCDGPLSPGTVITGAVDWPRRLRLMQCHTGEHIVSGLAHWLFGAENVGFHETEACVTLDLDRVLDAAELRQLEEAANDAVFQNRPVTARFVSPDELSSLDYRSKGGLSGAVRLVTVEGVDVCACCAPHVGRTGEIGLILLTDAMRHRGGLRLTLRAGLAALEDYRRKAADNAAVSRLLSAKADETPAAVSRTLAALEEAKALASSRSRALVACKIEGLRPTTGNLCLFEEAGDPIALRELANAGAALCGGVCAVFSGDDENGYQYIIAGRNAPLRARAAALNAALDGRGGGSDTMLQGSAHASREKIEAYFSSGASI